MGDKGKNSGYYTAEAVCWYGFSPLVPSEGKVTANTERKHYYHDGSGFPMTMSPITVHEGSLNALIRMKMIQIICYDLHQVLFHLHMYVRSWTALSETAN